MKKLLALFLLFLIQGCNNFNETLYLEVNKKCPIICNKKWTGLLRADPDVVKCMCDKEKRSK